MVLVGSLLWAFFFARFAAGDYLQDISEDQRCLGGTFFPFPGGVVVLSVCSCSGVCWFVACRECRVLVVLFFLVLSLSVSWSTSAFVCFAPSTRMWLHNDLYFCKVLLFAFPLCTFIA